MKELFSMREVGLKVWFVAIMAIVFIGAIGVSWSAMSSRVPVRTPPTPQGLIEQPLPSKKAQKARLLREAAEVMEEEARRDVLEFGDLVSKKASAALSTVDFSTDKFGARREDIVFMQVRREGVEKIVIQVTLGYSEK